jgi:hypothetical protein
MKPRDILALRIGTMLVDAVGGAEFSVEEVSPIIVGMFERGDVPDANTFCERLEVRVSERSER